MRKLLPFWEYMRVSAAITLTSRHLDLRSISEGDKCLDDGERGDDAHHMHTKRESRRDGDISWLTRGLIAVKVSI